MADEPDPMMREINDELRREQMAKLWDLYGIYAIIVAVLIIVGAGGYKWWEAHSLAAAQAAGARYETALQLADDGKNDEARQALEAMVKDAPAGYAALARLQLAGKSAAAGNKAEAQSLYDSLAADTSVDQLLRDYARLQSAALILDTADFTEMQNRLNPLMGESNAWRYSARELLGLAAYRAGRLDEARQTFLGLAADQKTPVSMRERVNLVMGLITAAEAAAAPAAAQPAAGGAPAEPAAKVQ